MYMLDFYKYLPSHTRTKKNFSQNKYILKLLNNSVLLMVSVIDERINKTRVEETYCECKFIVNKI